MPSIDYNDAHRMSYAICMANGPHL